MTALVVAVLELTPDCAVPRHDHDVIAWRADADEARREAMATQRVVLVFASAEWDTSSRALQVVTLRDRRVAELIDRGFVPLNVDVTDDEDPRTRKLLERFRIAGTPTVQAWTPDLQHQIGAIYEYVPPRCMLRALGAWREANARIAEGEAEVSWARSPARRCDAWTHGP
jgi:thiol:disulfide interchange protein